MCFFVLCHSSSTWLISGGKWPILRPPYGLALPLQIPHAAHAGQGEECLDREKSFADKFLQVHSEDEMFF